MTRVEHVTYLGGISYTKWKTRPCEKAGKTSGVDYCDLDFRWLTFVPPDCAAWLLYMEEDRPLNFLYTSKGLFPLLTGRENPL